MPYLDKNRPIEISNTGHLPHWHQDGKIQFVTFRLADSLPQDKITALKLISHQFEQLHPLPWDESTAESFRNQYGDILNWYLDKGYGECIFKSEIFRDILSNAISYFEGLRYEIIAYVIMPNHVHLLIQTLGDYKLADCIQSIKRYSSREINRLRNQEGTIWQREYFDRIVRDNKQLIHYIEYIKFNPHILPHGEYSLFINESWHPYFKND